MVHSLVPFYLCLRCCHCGVSDKYTSDVWPRALCSMNRLCISIRSCEQYMITAINNKHWNSEILQTKCGHAHRSHAHTQTQTNGAKYSVLAYFVDLSTNAVSCCLETKQHIRVQYKSKIYTNKFRFISTFNTKFLN